MSGLLSTLNTAVRGINVQQGNISTASHNIANVGTTGYSRQRTVVQTTRPFGGNSKYELCSYGQVGTGAEISDIMRIRDTFLDYQVRNEMSINANASQKSNYLTSVDNILNEVGDKGIQKCLTEFFNAYNDFATTPSSDTNRGLVYKAAQALAEKLNSKYTKVEEQKTDAQSELKTSVTNINDILDKINDLNKKIASVSSLGMSPNDYMDTRDNYLDQLSEQFGINVKRDSYNTINVSAGEISGINNLVNSSPSDMNYTRFSYVEGAEVNDAGTELTVTYSVLGNANDKRQFKITGTEAQLKSLKDDLLKNRVLAGDKDGLVTQKVTVDGTDANVTALKDFASSIKDSDNAMYTSGGWTMNADKTEAVNSDGTVVRFDKDTKKPMYAEKGTMSVVFNNRTGKVKSATMTSSSGGIDTRTEAIVDASGVITGGNNTKSSSAGGAGISFTSAASFDGVLVKNLEKGQVAAKQNVQDNIQGYLNKLDAFAAAFAYTVNAIQTGDTGDGAGAGITDKDGHKVAAEVIFTVKNADGTLTGNDNGISAKNISVNTNIETKLSILNAGIHHVDDYSGTKANERAQAIYKLKDLNIDMSVLFNSADGSIKDNTVDTRKNFFSAATNVGVKFSDATSVDLINSKNGTGSNMFNYYQNIIGTIANDAKSATSDASTTSDLLLQYNNSRLQVSGVSLDEEMANLVQFTHAFQANGRMINTVDKLLDVVINGLMN